MKISKPIVILAFLLVICIIIPINVSADCSNKYDFEISVNEYGDENLYAFLQDGTMYYKGRYEKYWIRETDKERFETLP